MILVSQAPPQPLNHIPKHCPGRVFSQPLTLKAGTSQARCLFSRRFWNSAWARASRQASPLREEFKSLLYSQRLVFDQKRNRSATSPSPILPPRPCKFFRLKRGRNTDTEDSREECAICLTDSPAAVRCLQQTSATRGGAWGLTLRNKRGTGELMTKACPRTLLFSGKRSWARKTGGKGAKCQRSSPLGSARAEGCSFLLVLGAFLHFAIVYTEHMVIL